jgi:hypothetical protein
MKKISLIIFLIIFIVLPSLIFAQGKKTSISLSAGINFPTSDYLISNGKNGYNASVILEGMSGSSFAWGGGINYSGFKSTLGTGNHWLFSLMGILKVQDNKTRIDEFQPYFKTGLGLTLIGGGPSRGHPNFPGVGITYEGAGGLGYFAKENLKIFIETGYRNTPQEKNSYGMAFISFGISSYY